MAKNYYVKTAGSADLIHTYANAYILEAVAEEFATDSQKNSSEYVLTPVEDIDALMQANIEIGAAYQIQKQEAERAVLDSAIVEQG